AQLYFKRAAGDEALFGPVHRLRGRAAETAGIFPAGRAGIFTADGTGVLTADGPDERRVVRG
ncbi:acyl-CoA dehydrogenase, partial [Streptomyces scabiei]|nr:acyl-CoA dehydrogenase [Streptomyces scabiei]